MNKPAASSPATDLEESAAGEEDPGAALDLPGVCPDCGGSGKIAGNECPTCHGTGKSVKPAARPGA